MELKVGMI